mmetsp:Transcript_11914/g.28235  ORF Transcript_11914/g.28235 Transcript_11914/m.28235 type:complete len:494 (-) Transcript_11914:1793-3274(-)
MIKRKQQQQQQQPPPAINGLRTRNRPRTVVRYVVHFAVLTIVGGAYVRYLMSQANLLNYPDEISFRSLKNMLPFTSPFEEGSWQCYLMHNPDLMKSLKWTKDDAELHYLLMGSKEKRRSSCRKEQERTNILKEFEGAKDDPFGLKDKYCCYLNFHENIGHVLTDNGLDLNRCGPVVSFLGSDYEKDSSVNKQFFQAGKLLNTKVVPREQCIDYYGKNPDEHPKVGRLKAYTRMDGGFETWYDATETSNQLRAVQKAMLESCGLDPIRYKPVVSDGGDGDDEDPYELVADRRPARSVMIVRRDPMRKLLNVKPLERMCTGLGLDCRVFEASRFFAKPPEDDDYLCAALREFNRDDPVVIGVMGAEMTYALLSARRIFLMAFNKNYHPRAGCRIGNNATKLEAEEERIDNGLICRGYAKGMDPFFMEFAFNYGARLTPIHSAEDPESLKTLVNSTKKQCIKSPYYCADRNADVANVQTELEELIRTGQLLPKRRG